MKKLEKKRQVKTTKANSKSTKRVISLSIILMLIITGVGFAFVPFFNNLKFGLDLQGGFEVLYQVETIDGSDMTADKVEATYKTLQKRINSLGVSEPEIIVEGDDKIRVKLAGVADPDAAREQLSTVATLSFRNTSDELLMTSDVIDGAKVSTDASGRPAVLLEVSDQNKFYEVTNTIKDLEDNQIVIWLDYSEGVNSYEVDSALCGTSGSNCLSSANVDQAFASDVIIQGDFTEEEVQNLTDLINAGSLPSKLTEVSSRTVGASFGDGTLDKTLLAGIIGISLIILLLVAIYRFAGFISGISIILYTFLVFVVFWTVGGVLTLPGIAALVLGIGMAIDSNVITFARIQEEIYKGKSLPAAFKSGSKLSFKTIFDANITTLIVAIIMFIFGESSVKGFATMLIITVAVTMFTMVLITRLIMKSYINTGFFNDKLKLFFNIKKDQVANIETNEVKKKSVFDKVNFLKHSPKFMILSLIILLSGVVIIFLSGMNLGIDFKSGSNITIDTKEEITKDELVKVSQELGISVDEIIISDDEISIKTDEVLTKEQVIATTNTYEDEYSASVDIAVISNVVSKDLAKNAVFAVLMAMIGIIIYVTFRFKFNYAAAGVIALLHDIAIVFALFAIFKIEVSVIFIAALLAIIGYSINDTIVLFDRIRENVKNCKEKLSKEKLKEIYNKSIRETFTRTIFTTITTLIPVIALIILVSNEILSFNLAMLFGLITGTYSSIFIAVNILLALEVRSLNNPKKKIIYTDEYKEKKVKGINC